MGAGHGEGSLIFSWINRGKDATSAVGLGRLGVNLGHLEIREEHSRV
jgi:hypothetical protein